MTNDHEKKTKPGVESIKMSCKEKSGTSLERIMDEKENTKTERKKR